MAETDILNPTDWLAAGIDFNPNPSYGFTRKVGANRQMQKPRLGPFGSRDVGNAGHTFSLQWIGIPLSIEQRIRQFYQSYKHGYFTLIDNDANGRHYVGRFMSEPEPSHPANGKYSIQGLVFEEVPTARMLVYPGDFANDGHTINVLDDFLKPLVALMQGAWAPQISPAAPASASATDPSVYEAYIQNPVLNDWAQMQYVGWGFQMTFRNDPILGLVHIALDSVQIVTGLDLSSGATAATSPLVTVTQGAGTTTVSITTVTLDMHRVKVTSAGLATGGGTGIIFPKLRYIY